MLKLEKEFTFRRGVADAILKIISIYSSLGVKSKLTTRESEFYVALVITTLLGHHIYSDEGDEIFESIFGKHKKYKRRDNLNKLVKKGWIEEIGGDIELPPFLRDINIEEGSFVFDVKITWDEKDIEVQ